MDYVEKAKKNSRRFVIKRKTMIFSKIIKDLKKQNPALTDREILDYSIAFETAFFIFKNPRFDFLKKKSIAKSRS